MPSPDDLRVLRKEVAMDNWFSRFLTDVQSIADSAEEARS